MRFLSFFGENGMPKVLTEASTVGCGHGPGKVGVSGSGKLTVSQKSVLLKSGIDGKGVSACATQPSNSTQPCATASVIAGEASKLTIGGKPVMLDTLLSGTTDGKPPGKLTAAAGQNKLTAV